MKRATLVLGLASSAVTVALVALVYSVGSHQSSNIVEPRQVQQTSPIDTEVNESTAVVESGQSLVGEQSPTISDTLPNIIPNTNLVHEDTSCKWDRWHVKHYLKTTYSLLLEHLGLTPIEKDALLSLLIEYRIAGMWTPYKDGKTIDMEERSKGIAAIIGDIKLEQFLALERNLNSYWEVQKIGSLLGQNSVPITDTQRDELLKILIETHDQEAKPPSGVERDSIEYLEYRLIQMDEYERHVLELAPSVLSTMQVVYLHDQYQYLSYNRTDSLERQRKQQADDTTEPPPCCWYPAN